MLQRLFFSSLLFYVAIFYPGIVFIILGFLGLFLFDAFYEFVIASFLIDILYGFPVEALYDFRFVFFLISLLLFVVANIIKTRIRFFEKV